MCARLFAYIRACVYACMRAGGASSSFFSFLHSHVQYVSTYVKWHFCDEKKKTKIKDKVEKSKSRTSGKRKGRKEEHE